MYRGITAKYSFNNNSSELQGPLNKAQSFAVPLKTFAEHVHEGQPEVWTYLEDELFIEMNPELRDYIGQPVSSSQL